MKKKFAKRHSRKKPKTVLRLPDLEHAKSAVLNSLTSIEAQRGYSHAINEFVDWYCSEEGNVSQASIDSQGPSRYFANQALHAAQNWKYTPALVDGRATASTWLLQFEFGQSQIAVTQSEEAP